MIWLIIWNIVFLIIFFLLIPVTFFNRKLRQGFWKRFFLLRKVKQWKKDHPGDVITIHTASYGEFEHIRPLVNALKKHFNGSIVVLFFSPSGYEYLKEDPSIDGVFYTPFELYWISRHFFKILRPSLHLVAKHDVWPTEISVLHHMKIPLVLINASLSANSSRIRYFPSFHRYFYRMFSRIYAIDREDANRYIEFLRVQPEKIRITGDTKNDQVLFRKEKALSRPIFPNYRKKEGQIIFVAGSIWNEDWDYLHEPLQHLLHSNPEFSVILCPHELKDDFVEKLADHMKDFSPVIVGQDANLEDIREVSQVMIIHRMGILADIYSLADFAFVGGSFKGKVHNVLEPAIYGIPVITGPYIENSTEAIQLRKQKGLFVAHSAKNMQKLLNRLLNDETFRREHGIYASNYVVERLNTIEKIITDLRETGLINEGIQ